MLAEAQPAGKSSAYLVSVKWPCSIKGVRPPAAEREPCGDRQPVAPGEYALALSVEHEVDARASLRRDGEGAPRDHRRRSVGTCEEDEAQPARLHLLALHFGLDVAAPVVDAEQSCWEVGGRWCQGFPCSKAGSTSHRRRRFSYPSRLLFVPQWGHRARVRGPTKSCRRSLIAAYRERAGGSAA